MLDAFKVSKVGCLFRVLLVVINIHNINHQDASNASLTYFFTTIHSRIWSGIKMWSRARI